MAPMTGEKQQGNQLDEALSGGPKRKRNGRACDRCHRNACRCSPGIEGTVCSKCEDQQLECTYNRPVKRRGPPPARRSRRVAESDTVPTVDYPPTTTQSAETLETMAMTTPPLIVPTGPSNPSISSRANDDNTISSPQVANFYSTVENILSPKTIERLVEIFYHTIYPIRPYFHWPTFDMQVRQQMYRSDWGVYVVTMALCALTAGRVQVSTDINLSSSEAVNLSLQCYAAAVSALPTDVTTINDYCQAMKASALLASVCLQNGDLTKVVSHLANYSCLSTIHKFHLEAHWPTGLTEIQRQERRRLFWCVYQQERYLSINFELPTQQSEGKSTVIYPAEVSDDDEITATGLYIRSDQVSFLRGWNFCTDMYRLLENMDHVKRVRQEFTPEKPGSLTDSFLSRISVPKDFISESLHFISKMHSDLPPELKTVQNLTGDPQTDRCKFVASNILLTTQNLKMYLVGTEQPSMHLRCSIASELLDELSSVPLEFFQNLSTGSLHHLAQVGQMLGAAIQPPISAWRYLQVRNILLILTDFLEKIESTRISPSNLSVKLRTQMSEIDRSMQESSARHQAPGLLSMGRSLLLGLPDKDGVENNTQINEHRDGSPSHYLNTIRQTPQTFSPSMSQFARLLDMTDSIPPQYAPQQSQSAPLVTEAIETTQAQVTEGIFNIAQPMPMQNPPADFIFPLTQSNPFSGDLFDGWQTMFKVN